VRTTAALAGVVALILLLGWGYRAMLGAGPRSWTTRGRQPALLEVVSRTALSARQSLCLVRCGPRLVLLGITADAIRSLDVITDADVTARLLGEAVRQRPDSSTAEFARCLEREAHAYPDDRAPPQSTHATDDQQLAALRDRLADTLSKLRAKTGGA
jgi:flagellar biogenesis protein FliO